MGEAGDTYRQSLAILPPPVCAQFPDQAAITVSVADGSVFGVSHVDITAVRGDLGGEEGVGEAVDVEKRWMWRRGGCGEEVVVEKRWLWLYVANGGIAVRVAPPTNCEPHQPRLLPGESSAGTYRDSSASSASRMSMSPP